MLNFYLLRNRPLVIMCSCALPAQISLLSSISDNWIGLVMIVLKQPLNFVCDDFCANLLANTYINLVTCILEVAKPEFRSC